MIFDPEIELKNIESQPEWIGVHVKIKQLQDKRADLMAKYDKFENLKILNAVTEVDKDLELFNNIIAFWIRNHRGMKALYNSFAESITEINKGAKQLNLINDLRIAYTMEGDTQQIISESFIQLAESKGMDVKDMKQSFKKLQDKINQYWKHMLKELK